MEELLLNFELIDSEDIIFKDVAFEKMTKKLSFLNQHQEGDKYVMISDNYISWSLYKITE